MPEIVLATLIKRRVSNECPRCESSLMEINDDVELGKQYRIDLSTRQVKQMFNTDHAVKWSAEMVEDADCRGMWLPIEILSWK